MVKRDEIVNRSAGMQKYFRYPRNQDQNENEHVITLQPSPYCFQFADFEAGQNQIFANEFFPFALKHLPIFHYHRDQKMRFEHPDTRAERIVKTIPARLDPEQ